MILAASSIECTVAHNTKSRLAYFSAVLLGFWFCLNQISELNSFLTLFGSEEISLVLASLTTHLSHLILSLILFTRVFVFESDVRMTVDNVANFVSAY